MSDDNPIVAVADLIGFIGAILLAIPFLFGQRPRDTVLLALARPATGGGFDEIIQKRVAHIANYWTIEMNCARLGVIFIGLAFLIRSFVALNSLHKSGYF
jgi:hypothetical protein